VAVVRHNFAPSLKKVILCSWSGGFGFAIGFANSVSA